jgi:nucleoside-diphosphate-sugar epimerase
MTKISRVLILGCTGLVGHGISLYLLKNKYNIVGTTNIKEAKSLYKNFKIYNKINLLYEKSFIKLDKIIKKHKIQAIINTAALVPNKPNYKKKNFYNNSLIINTFSFFKLYKIGINNNIKFLINISTPNIKNIKNLDLENHHNFYIFTKYLVEFFLSNLKNTKTNITSLRIKSPYGYILDTKAVVPNFIHRTITNKKMILKGNIHKKQIFTFVEDIGSACNEIFVKNLSGIKSCLGTELVSIKELSDFIYQIFSKNKNKYKTNSLNKYHYKNNINKLKTPLLKGLAKILNMKKDYEIFKMK